MGVQSPSVYTDIQGLASLKTQAREKSEGSLDQVAKQFESLMMAQMLKSMRQANLGEGLMDSDQTLFYRDMYDQQLAIHLSESGGIGLSDVIKRQLGGAETAKEEGAAEKVDGAESPHAPMRRNMSSTPGVLANTATISSQPDFDTPEAFVQALMPWAEEAAAKIGISPVALLSQAAVETGWGQRMIQTGSGVNSHNLFGIKAGNGWEGDRALHQTVEFEDGVAVRRKEPFRAYDSYRESFMDYVDFLQSNPRYRETLQATQDAESYFRSLQQAGYATDPNYADKVLGVAGGDVMNAAIESLKKA